MLPNRLRTYGTLVLLVASAQALAAQDAVQPNQAPAAAEGQQSDAGQAPRPPQTAAASQAEGGQAKVSQATGQPAPDGPPPPDLSIPEGADVAALCQIVATAKGFRPRSPAQYRLQQTAIGDASNLLIQQIENAEDPVRRQAELDALAADAALMVHESDDARDKVLEKITTYLKGRPQLSLADVQTAIIVATYLELQPRKQPARDVYMTMVELLEDDEREEMQALRFNLQATVRRLEMLGKKFELSAQAIDGQPIRIEDLEGKFVIIDFFATWCKPCIAEMPRLKKYYDKYRDRGLEIVAISLDNEREALDKYLAAAALPWPIVHDSTQELEDKLQTKYGIASLPTVLLLNRAGVVVSLEAHGAELDRLMDRLFEMPARDEAETK